MKETVPIILSDYGFSTYPPFDKFPNIHRDEKLAQIILKKEECISERYQDMIIDYLSERYQVDKEEISYSSVNCLRVEYIEKGRWYRITDTGEGAEYIEYHDEIKWIRE